MKKTMYRVFDSCGVLIYVGSTINIVKRLSCHKNASKWFFDAASITLEHFESAQEAYAAEIRSVSIENPKYNVYLRHEWIKDIPPLTLKRPPSV